MPGQTKGHLMATSPLSDTEALTEALNLAQVVLQLANMLKNTERRQEVALQVRNSLGGLTRLRNSLSPQTIRNSGHEQRLPATIARLNEVLQELENLPDPPGAQDLFAEATDQEAEMSSALYTPSSTSRPLTPQDKEALSSQLATIKSRIQSVLDELRVRECEVDAIINLDENQYFQDPTNRLPELDARLQTVGTLRCRIRSAVGELRRTVDDLTVLFNKSGADSLQQIGQLDSARQACVDLPRRADSADEKLLQLEEKIKVLEWVRRWVHIGTTRDQQILVDFNRRSEALNKLFSQMEPMLKNAEKWRHMLLDQLMSLAPQTQPGQEPPIIRQMEETPDLLQILVDQTMEQLNDLQKTILEAIPEFVLIRCGVYEAATDLLQTINTFLANRDQQISHLREWLAIHLPLYRKHWRLYWQQYPVGKSPGEPLKDEDLYD